MNGIKHDSNKDPWHLLPIKATVKIVKVLGYGAIKYGPENWRLLDNFEDRYFSACLRHLIAWKLGEKYDTESRHEHLAHAACCLLFLLEGKDEKNK